MPKLTIDNKEIEVAQGTRIIEAAKALDIDIPFYCYHPGLSVAGNCRMCLVEIEKLPKLQLACHIQAQEGMVVRTDTERVQNTRKHVLEFLLINHPVDCPVCDQAGECWLQDYYLNYGAYESRLNENKVKKPKAQSIGPTVMLDAERCILCSRCVRFCDEISKTSELGIANRGDHSEIMVFPGEELNNPYSGNVVDICPVGALTDKDFRFKMRVWYLKSEDTLCNGCARGCNIQMHYKSQRPHHAKSERVIRLKPRYNEEVNQWWMCDEGRYGYKYHDHNRILEPLKRSGSDTVQEIGWQQAIAEVAEKIENAQGKIAVFLSPQLSNEELFLAKKIFDRKAKHAFLVSPHANGFQDDILIRADKNPNTRGAKYLGCTADEKAVAAFYQSLEKEAIVDGVIVFGQDLLTLHGQHLAQKQFQNLKWSVFIGSNHNLMSEYAHYVLPAATYAEKEGSFTNFEGKTQKFNSVLLPMGNARSEWLILKELASALGMHCHYEEAEEIFEELASKNKHFEGLTYEKIQKGETDMRKIAAPMIPSLEQDSKLIFYSGDHEPKEKLTT